MLLRLLSLALFGLLAGPAHADIFWTGATDSDIFEDGNWDLSGSSVIAVDANVTINDNVWIVDAPVPVEFAELPGQVRFQVGDGFTLTITNSLILTQGNDGFGGEPGTLVGPLLVINGGADLGTFFIANRVHLELEHPSSCKLGGGATPINGATVNLTLDARLTFQNETVADFTAEHLNKVTVDNLPAVIGGNITVTASGLTGCVVRVIPPWTNYCVALANSTGLGAFISASGTASVAANDLVLRAGPIAAGEPGIFYYGPAQSMLAFGDGLRCVSGSSGTVVRIFPFVQADAQGMLELAFDNTGPAHAQVVAGATLNFQGWFRDPAAGASGFNLSDGLSVPFVP